MSALSRKRDASADEALAWLLRLENGCSEEERANFMRWFKQSAFHREQFLVTLGLREGIKRLDVASELANIEVHENASFRGNSRGEGARLLPISLVRAWHGRGWGRPIAIGAAVLIAVATLSVPLLNWLTTARDELVAPLDPSQVIALRDGSTIQLNTQARAVMVTSRHFRELRLNGGDALVSVSHDPLRPFRLTSGSFVVQDIGTRFIASSLGRGFKVLVLDGRVRLTRDCRAGGAAVGNSLVALVESQEEVSVPDDRCVPGIRPRVLSPHEMNQEIAWTLGRVPFDDDRLADVADRFNRYNALQLRVDPAVGDRRVSGRFLITDPEGFVHSIESSLGLKVSAVPAADSGPPVLHVVDSHRQSDAEN